MKRLIIVLVLSVWSITKADAQIMITNTAKVQFFSETPVENISAVNANTSSLLNTATDSVFIKIKNTSFAFKNALMQDHFNENYMESDKYPYSTFKGKINQAIDYKKEGTYKVSVSGKMNIHGVERPVVANGVMTVKADQISVSSDFTVKTADYKIDIPKLVFQKIAEEIKVSFNATYNPAKK